MKIIIAHNYYQQKGGEDLIFQDEAALLEKKGHNVKLFSKHNDSINEMNIFSVAVNTVWNRSVYIEARDLMKKWQPDVIHLHNTFPLTSPAIYYAAKKEGIPVVQTLHNYRLICPNALLFKEGQICQHCLGKVVPLAGVRYKCYRQSRAASAVVAGMLTVHRLLGTWRNKIDIYVVYPQFARPKFIQSGLPAEKIFEKPNFVYPDPGIGKGSGGYAVFVGRLTEEKGIKTLLSAWKKLNNEITLKIAGDGPLANYVANNAKESRYIEYLGWQATDEVKRLIGEAKVLIFPSEWYEPFGRVAIEAFAKSTPVIASKHIAQIVDHGRTGLLFEPGNSDDLADKIRLFFSDPNKMVSMRNEARSEYEVKYTAEVNYKILMDIYLNAIDRSKAL